METNFKFDASLVAKMAPFVSNEETRYYLCGIHMAANPGGGVRLAATDGHALIVAHDPEGEYNGPVEGLIIAVNGHKPFVSACRKKGRVVAGTIGPNTLIVRFSDSPAPEYIHPEPFIDGLFPDYNLAVPQFSDDHRGMKGTFNPKLLNCFIGFGQRVTLYQKGDTDPIIVLLPDPNAFGVIMPMRGCNTPPAFWFDQPGKCITAEDAAA